jgi:hypothetical protein
MGGLKYGTPHLFAIGRRNLFRFALPAPQVQKTLQHRYFSSALQLHQSTPVFLRTMKEAIVSKGS